MSDEIRHELLSAGLSITNSLDRELVKCPVMPDPFGKQNSIEEKTLFLENWIALYLTQSEEPGDVIAVCLSHEPSHATLHVVTGDRNPTVEEKNRMKELIDMTEAIVRAQLAGVEEKGQHDIQDEFLAVITKAGGTARIPGDGYALGKIDDLLDKWVAHCETKKRPVDTSEFLADFLKGKNRTPHDAIRGHLNAILRLEAPNESDTDIVAKRHDYFDSAITLCENLNSIDLFTSSVSDEKDRDWTRQLNTEESLLVRELYRCIQAVYEYHVGADVYLKSGGRFLRKAFGSKIGSVPFTDILHVIWVNESFTIAKAPEHRWPSETPLEFITKRMEGRSPITMTPVGENELKKRCSSLWKAGSTITGLRLHPEIKLAIYLNKKEIKPLRGVVGVSEPPCFACGEYYVFIPLKIREQSQKVQTDWLGPVHLTKVRVSNMESSGYSTAAFSALGAADNAVDTFLQDVQGDGTAGSGTLRARYSTKADDYTARLRLI